MDAEAPSAIRASCSADPLGCRCVLDPSELTACVPRQFVETSNFHFAGVGLGTEGASTLDFYEELLGQTTPGTIELGSSSVPVTFFEGMELSLSNQPFKNTFTARGPAESGLATLWSLGGDVALDRLPINAPAPITELPRYFSTVGAAVLGIWSSSVRLEQRYGPPEADAGYPEASLALLEGGVPLDLQATVALPTAPFPGPDVGHYLLSISAHAPGLGRAPLGVAGAEPIALAANGAPIMGDLSTGLQGPLPVRFAPRHHGLENAPVELEILAGNDAILSGPPTTAIIVPLSDCSAASDEFCDGAQIDPQLPLLPIPQGGAFDPGSRAFTAPVQLNPAPWMRVAFGSPGQRWDVYGLTANFALPTPRASIGDRANQQWELSVLDLTEEPSSITGPTYHLPGALGTAIRRFATESSGP